MNTCVFTITQWLVFFLQIRPTPPHLTSPVAESLLSQACENETLNIKRLREGLEPLSTLAPMKRLANSMSATSSPAIHKSNASAAAAIAAASAVSMPSLMPASMGQAPSQPAGAAAQHRMLPDWRSVCVVRLPGR